MNEADKENGDRKARSYILRVKITKQRPTGVSAGSRVDVHFTDADLMRQEFTLRERLDSFVWGMATAFDLSGRLGASRIKRMTVDEALRQDVEKVGRDTSVTYRRVLRAQQAAAREARETQLDLELVGPGRS